MTGVATSNGQLDQSKTKKPTLTNLQPSIKTISLRLLQYLLDSLKVTTDARALPWQLVIKLWFYEEFHSHCEPPVWLPPKRLPCGVWIRMVGEMCGAHYIIDSYSRKPHKSQRSKAPLKQKPRCVTAAGLLIFNRQLAYASVRLKVVTNTSSIQTSASSFNTSRIVGLAVVVANIQRRALGQRISCSEA